MSPRWRSCSRRRCWGITSSRSLCRRNRTSDVGAGFKPARCGSGWVLAARGETMTRKEAAFIRQARVGHLATVDEQGQPLNLPFCFAFDGECLYSPIDEKPKSRSAAGTEAAPEHPRQPPGIRGGPPLRRRRLVPAGAHHHPGQGQRSHGRGDAPESRRAPAPEIPPIPSHGPGRTAHDSDPGGAVHSLGQDLTMDRGAPAPALSQRRSATPPPP